MIKYRLALVLIAVSTTGGCAWWGSDSMRSQSPEPVADLESLNIQLVGDLAVPFGMYPIRIEDVGLVTNLRGTGCDPRPSPQRQALLGEMQTRGVTSPNSVLGSLDTAMVLVRATLPPGVQKGDRIDVEVRIPSQSETTSLRGGWLMQTRLKELAVLNHEIRDGHTLGLASGPLMVDPSANDDENRVLMGRGKILGGAVALRSRPLALVLKPENQSIINSARLETAINKRFHSLFKGTKVGVAKAKTDEYLELVVHPRYKNNIERYVRVVRAIAMRETELTRMKRLTFLEKELHDPLTSARAALQLEAMGRQAIDVLLTGIESPNPEVRFKAAESLAFLDESAAAQVLAETARSQPAFRVFALSALSVMKDDFSAIEKLRELLGVASAETRYGAFRALWTVNPNEPMIMGEMLGKTAEEQFSYHLLRTDGPPMIHVTGSRRPEIVLFGEEQRLKLPITLQAGNEIMITTSEQGRIVVSRFAVGETDQKRTVSNRVDDVIRAVSELGGTYPDIVQTLQEANAKNALAGRFEVDALPGAGRVYDRTAAKSQSGQSTVADDQTAGSLASWGGVKRFFGGKSTAESDVEPVNYEENVPIMPDSPPSLIP